MKAKPRILFVIESLAIAGAEQLVTRLSAALNDKGLHVEVAVLWPPYTLGEEIEKSRVLVHRLNISHRWNLVEAAGKLHRLMKEKQFDIVHSHLFFATLDVAFALKFGFKAKHFVSLHGFEFDRDRPRSLLPAIRQRVRKNILRNHVDCCIAVSEAVASHYRKHILRDDIKVIYNALSNKVYETRNQQEPSACIAVPARLIPEKGHEVLLKALQKLKKHSLILDACFFGVGPLREKLEAQIQAYGLQPQVQLRSPLAHSDLLNELSRFKLVVLPSVSEGFGMAAAEAMALGKVVIASRVGGLEEIIEDKVTGLLFECGNSDDLAEKIRFALNAPNDFRAIGLRAQTVAREKFFLENIINKWIDLYESAQRHS